ncbi:putative nucleic acid-binding Zn-ribbon protein [Algoriphagus sp. 4150]|uniref:hypothetical protein n=1 Tax=Algoriphagus sp. 4150 TaxID=2817756 RepID=UPI002863B861|nr:hypothetical protein [Algoriphagus sp. 4150]MDR7131928.1 putative nucleic acid-binding Zn-ribbon protein [Algoriphagus sp. 4150]
MKGYILGLIVAVSFASCEHASTQNQSMDELKHEWEKTSGEAQSLSEKLGQLHADWQALYRSDSLEVPNGNTNCEEVGKAYEDMHIQVQSFVDEGEKESAEIDRLSNQFIENTMSEEDQNQLKSLQLAIDERKEEIDRWKYNLDSLQKICSTPNEITID